MRSKKMVFFCSICAVIFCVLVSGCANLTPRSKQKIDTLQAKVETLEKQREKERAEFENMRQSLEKKLSQQIANKDVSVSMDERGLVIILSDAILFDSGKAEIKQEALPVIENVATAIKENVPGKNIGVSGHTDNMPITYSGWKSNWELSTARATNVLHGLEDKGILPNKLSATGYGEYRPVASNDTPEGRSKNRRVEILILPDFIEKKQAEAAATVPSETESDTIK